MKNSIQLTLLGALTFGTLSASDFEGIVLYEHAHFGGASLVLYPGEGIPNLHPFPMDYYHSWNDEVSSVAVWGPVTVYLYEHANYQGDVIVLNEHSPALFEWNDTISSVYVEYSVFTGWLEDTSLDSWVYWENNGWIWHEQGLGWLYGANYEPSVGGWLWDLKLGWLYTNAAIYPWFLSPGGTAYYYYTGNPAERWFYDAVNGWKIR